MQRTELRALTSLRGIAAMAVVLQHFSATAAAAAGDWVPSLVPHGYMAVDFFFILSGFIMAYTYLPDFERNGMQEYGPFLYKRIARIFPLGIAVTALILAGAAVASKWQAATLFIPAPVLEGDLARATLVNVAHLQGFLPRYNLNGPSWSVSLELGAYLLFPLLLRLFCSKQADIAALATACSLVMLLLLECADPKAGSAYPPAWDIARCVAEFGLGLITCRVYSGSPALHAIGQDRWTVAAAALTIVSGLCRLDLLTALSFPPLILAFALNRGRASRLLSSPAPYFVGVISFSVYLTHNLLRAPALALLIHLYPEKLGTVQALLFAAAGSLLVLPFATVSYYLVEKPGRATLNRLVRFLTPTHMPPVRAG